MANYLDLATWPRRAAFEHFKTFDQPFFGVCTRVDAAPLKAALGAGGGFAAACWFTALRLANTIEPFRYRLQGDRVRVLDVVHGSTTVLKADETFSFAYLDWQPAWPAFRAAADAAVDAAKTGRVPFEPRVDEDALVHFTTLPWVHFTAFSHARHLARGDSVPKVSFGRLESEGERLWLPLSVEAHHALVDGVHVGRFVEGFEEALARPGWVSPP